MNFPYHSPPIIAGFGFARARDKAFAAVRRLWKLRQQQGMTQTDIAQRLGKDPAWVCRKLSGPSNWTLRTFGDLADALDGDVEIRIIDLKSGHSTSNFDAYSGYGMSPLKISRAKAAVASSQGKLGKFEPSTTNANVAEVSMP